MKIFIAIPAYDRKVSVETARSLLNEQAVAAAAGHEIETHMLPGCSLITMARNQLVSDFLASDADRLVFIDADLSWQPGMVLKLCSHDAPCVGGAYRFKQAIENYPVSWADPEITDDKRRWAEMGLMVVNGLPGGFMALTREAFDAFRDHHGDRAFEHFGHAMYAYFTAPYRNGHLMGEDSAFCVELREAGVPVLLDPDLSITHHDGPNAYPGNIATWLRARVEAQQAAQTEPATLDVIADADMPAPDMATENPKPLAAE